MPVHGRRWKFCSKAGRITEISRSSNIQRIIFQGESLADENIPEVFQWEDLIKRKTIRQRK